MALRGGDYQLEAKFTASVDQSVNRSFGQMQSKLEKLEKKLNDLEKHELSVPADVDTAAAEKKIQALEKRLNALDRKSVSAEANLDIDRNWSRFGLMLTYLTAKALPAFGKAVGSAASAIGKTFGSVVDAALGTIGEMRGSLAGKAGLIALLGYLGVAAAGPAALGLLTLASAGTALAGGLGMAAGSVVTLLKDTKRFKAEQNDLKKDMKGLKDSFFDVFSGGARVAYQMSQGLVRIAHDALPLLGRTNTRVMKGIQDAFRQTQQEFVRNRGLESFRRILNSLAPITRKIGVAIGRFGTGLLNLLAAAMPQARRFAGWLADISRQFVKWTQSDKGRRQIQNFLKSAAPTARALWRIFTRIAGAILSWNAKNPRALARAINSIWRFGRHAYNIISKLWELFGRVSGIENPLLRLVAIFVLWRSKMLLLRIAWAIISRVFVRNLVFMIRGAGSAVARILMVFGRLTAIGLIAWYLVNVFRRGYQQIVQHTIPTIRGLYQMWQQGSISLGDCFGMPFVRLQRV